MTVNKNMKFIYVFLTVLLITAGISTYGINDYDRIWLRLTLPADSSKTVTVDIAEQHPVKYYLQPGTFTVYGLIKNTGTLKKLTAEFSGADVFISQGSKKTKWDPITSKEYLRENKRGNIPLNMDISVPYSRTRRHDVAEAGLVISSNGKKVSLVRFLIINSKY